ncbi:MAG: hypothetical protein IPK58_26125 [Acidobacteria bacterium]|nr:hypothetical protein [Acidobacteriota bacterium]
MTLQRKTSFPLLGLLFAVSAVAAEAHVKWFFDYDVTKPPTPIGEVIDGTFVKMFLVSVAACYLFFLADRYIYEEGILSEFDKIEAFRQRCELYYARGGRDFFLRAFQLVGARRWTEFFPDA